MGKTIDMMGAIELDSVGRDLEIYRWPAEPDVAYRERIRAVIAENAAPTETLRDQIAIEAMKIVFQASLSMDFNDNSPFEELAAISYRMADAMLTERAK